MLNSESCAALHLYSAETVNATHLQAAFALPAKLIVVFHLGRLAGC